MHFRKTYKSQLSIADDGESGPSEDEDDGPPGEATGITISGYENVGAYGSCKYFFFISEAGRSGQVDSMQDLCVAGLGLIREIPPSGKKSIHWIG